MTDGLDRNATVSRAEGQVSCEIDKEVVALSVAKGRYFQIDEVGSFIWASLEKPLSIGKLCDRLGEAFEVDPDVCERDTFAFLREMNQAGLLKWDEGVVAKA